MLLNSKGSVSPLIIAAVLAVVAIGYYVLAQQGSLPVPGISLTPRATEKDFAFIEDATLRKHFVAQANQTTYRTKSYSTGADLNFVTEVQIRGENFNTRDIEYDHSGKETKHKVALGDTAYVKDYADGKWWKQTFTPEEATTEEEETKQPTDFKEEYTKQGPTYKALGKEPCGNLMCFKYQEQDTEKGGLGLLRTFWFDDRKYLLRKEESTAGEFSVQVEYSYDGINITTPSPTKDVPKGKSIYDYYYQAPSNSQVPSAQEIKKIQQQFGVPEQNPDTNYNYDSSDTSSDNN